MTLCSVVSVLHINSVNSILCICSKWISRPVRNAKLLRMALENVCTQTRVHSCLNEKQKKSDFNTSVFQRKGIYGSRGDGIWHSKKSDLHSDSYTLLSSLVFVVGLSGHKDAIMCMKWLLSGNIFSVNMGKATVVGPFLHLLEKCMNLNSENNSQTVMRNFWETGHIHTLCRLL